MVDCRVGISVELADIKFEIDGIQDSDLGLQDPSNWVEE